jgi:hypothetical protein
MSSKPLPTIESFLSVPGQQVTIEDRGPQSPCALTQHLATATSWIRLVPAIADQPRQIILRGTKPHGSIQFWGEVENRMIEPLVLTLRALATGEVDLDTPATPAFLQDLHRNIDLQWVISEKCPFCPAATSVVLRLPCLCPRISVQVIRADIAGAPKVHAVPTLLENNHLIASGPIQEMKLVELLLEQSAKHD